jgi:CheY-like chemotaxis protein
MAQKTFILVVEDEALLRMGAVQMLEDAGFAVLEAANALEAISILKARDDIRAIFTDVNMPGSMDGLRLARMVRGRWPPIHLIVTSGLVSPNDDDLPPGGKFISKPYDPAHVIATIRALLGQAPPADPLLHARKTG